MKLLAQLISAPSVYQTKLYCSFEEQDKLFEQQFNLEFQENLFPPTIQHPLNMIQSVSLQSLWMSFAVIVISEIGDKTFLIAAVMAMTNSRMVIFSAAISALAVMTVLSALFGHFLPNLLSKEYTQFAASGLFIVFGIKMLYDGVQMSDNEGQEELEEVSAELIAKESEEKDDKLESGGKLKEKDLGERLTQGARNIANYFFSAVFIQTFVLTFLAEWGDRSQIATIALAGAEDFWWVTIGSLIGHALCSAVAVIGGRLLASKISVRTVTILGAIIFIICGVYSFMANFYKWNE